MGKLFLDRLKGHTGMETPIWLMRQAGRYLPEYRNIRQSLNGFTDLCYTPQHATEVTLQPLRRYHFDAAILFSDILVIPHALGQDLTFKEKQGPVLGPLHPEGLQEKFKRDAFRRHLDPVKKTIESLKKNLPPETALIGFCGAPWTVSTYMLEGGSSKNFLKTKQACYGNTRLFKALIDRLVEASSDYLCLQAEAGAEALQIFDTWSGVLPEKEFRKWCIEPCQRIIENVRRKHPDIPIICFPKGAGFLYEDFVRQTGCTAISLDASVPLDWARRVLQPLVPVQGNLDPCALVVGGDFLDASVDTILENLAGGPFIFNLGHGILPETPPEHVDRLVKRVRSFRRKT
ncbi:MAG: uroporphyrinogen decarboxylase [Flavobacteriia bacterium]|nr:uroporphyrinogen decarboxylase [Flavobacteriia bacterium]